MPKNPQLIHSSTSQHLQQPNHPIASNFPHKSVTRIHHTTNWPSRKQVETTWHPMEFQQIRMGVPSLQINCQNLGRHRWKMAIRTMNQKGWEIFKPNCAPQSLELDHRSKKLKTANPLPFAPNLIPQYRDHLLAFQDCSFVTEAQYQFYAPMLNHLPTIVTKRWKTTHPGISHSHPQSTHGSCSSIERNKTTHERRQTGNFVQKGTKEDQQQDNCQHHCHHACTLLCRKTMPPNSQRTLDKPSPTWQSTPSGHSPHVARWGPGGSRSRCPTSQYPTCQASNSPTTGCTTGCQQGRSTAPTIAPSPMATFPCRPCQWRTTRRCQQCPVTRTLGQCNVKCGRVAGIATPTSKKPIK